MKERDFIKAKLFRVLFLFLVPAAALVSPGCRQVDERTLVVAMPGLTEAKKGDVVAALAKYDGVCKDSYVWDMAAKTLTLRYDSMKIAHTNIRMAIAEKGIEVTFPENPNGIAGYVDEKTK